MTTIEKIYDNTKDGVPNYRINTTDGKVLYCSGVPLYPVPKNGDKIKYDIISTKTSANGNAYTTIKNIEITDTISGDEPVKQPSQSTFNKSDNQMLLMFVTGVVGRSLSSGTFTAEDIPKLTSIAVRAFNENIKEL